MSTLQSSIENAANAFAKEIIAAVKGASLQELLAMQGEAPTASGRKRGRPPKAKTGRKPGRPAKAKPGRKPGRPAKAAAKKTTKKAAKAPAKKRRKIAWPKCKHRGCKKNAWRRGNGFCGKHFKA